MFRETCCKLPLKEKRISKGEVSCRRGDVVAVSAQFSNLGRKK